VARVFPSGPSLRVEDNPCRQRSRWVNTEFKHSRRIASPARVKNPCHGKLGLDPLVTPSIRAAVEILRAGGLVALPTETVYGLGADATNATAVRKIFAAKGRPGTNPLIVHVASTAVARRYARQWPASADALARQFWPGPLTLVLPKSGAIVDEVSAGLDTVGLRAPDHPLALELLGAFDGPVAAPSANRSNRVSPTTADHVRRELGNAVDFILDGGPCRVGIESTVLDLSQKNPIILRPGAVTREQIEAVIGPVGTFHGSIDATTPAQSPGQQAVHYAPSAPTWRFTRAEAGTVSDWCKKHPHDPVTILSIGEDLSVVEGLRPGQQIVAMPADPAAYAQQLYAALHDADSRGVAAIFIETPPDSPQWAAVRDRLFRATRPI
jgi:L-threonylcarbamoyladenylate synthase